MNKAWLVNGAPPGGFPWHGSSDPGQRKAIVDPYHSFKQIWYLERLLEVARSVGRVSFPNDLGYASCFLVAPTLILTNHHVFETPQDTAGVVIQFNYRTLPNGDLAPYDEYQLDPGVFITDDSLDFTLVALATPAKQPYLHLRHNQKAALNAHVAIVQHPQGEPLQVAIRDNALVYDDATSVEYLTNTEYGTSGSPVFNAALQVIALHSQRVPDPNVLTDYVWYRNKGFKIEAILKYPNVDTLIPKTS